LSLIVSIGFFENSLDLVASGIDDDADGIGDTVRWKSENVSTVEVASVLRACAGVQDAIVCGIAVPAADGRAGMALLKIDGKFDLDGLPARLEILPKYARPLFIRFATEIETTETFKPKRRDYVDQGLTPNASTIPFTCSMASENCMWRSMRDGTPQSGLRHSPFESR
jgi:fatty-acyl-CoA synthase